MHASCANGYTVLYRHALFLWYPGHNKYIVVPSICHDSGEHSLQQFTLLFPFFLRLIFFLILSTLLVCTLQGRLISYKMVYQLCTNGNLYEPNTAGYPIHQFYSTSFRMIFPLRQHTYVLR